MKNIAISTRGAKKIVSMQDLIDVMVPNCEYTAEEIIDLLPDSPKMSVRDTLHTLVGKGVVWRNASSSHVKFTLLTGDALREAIERKTARAEPPAWMRSNLTGYEAEQRRFRDLCMKSRR